MVCFSCIPLFIFVADKKSSCQKNATMNQVRRRNATINHPGQRGTPQPQQGNTKAEILLPCVSCSKIRGCFIYILYSSNSSSFTFWWLLALDATEPVSEPVTQMAVEPRGGYDYFLKLLFKSSSWFTEKHIFKIIMYIFWKQFKTSRFALKHPVEPPIL